MIWHWSTDIKKFKKENPEGFKFWRLEQLINYSGLGKEKLSKKEIKKYWFKLKNKIDSDGKRMIEFFLWGKQYSLQSRRFFWEK